MNTSDKVLASFNLRAADVYSYAMLLFELWECKLSYHEKNQYQAIWSIMQGDRPAISDKAPKVVADLIQKCWSHDPNNSPDISMVLRALKQIPPTKPDGTPVINQDDIVMGSGSGPSNWYHDISLRCIPKCYNFRCETKLRSEVEASEKDFGRIDIAGYDATLVKILNSGCNIDRPFQALLV